MNREIKFDFIHNNAGRKYVGSWPQYCLLTAEGKIVSYVGILREYIGRKDAKGNHVYEGDIIKLNDGGDISHHRIYWDEEQCMFKDERIEDGDCLRDYLNDFSFISDGFIIGNIYEHPHLISND